MAEDTEALINQVISPRSHNQEVVEEDYSIRTELFSKTHIPAGVQKKKKKKTLNSLVQQKQREKMSRINCRPFHTVSTTIFFEKSLRDSTWQ